jgi:hypothetical protein
MNEPDHKILPSYMDRTPVGDIILHFSMLCRQKAAAGKWEEAKADAETADRIEDAARVFRDYCR